MRCDFSEKFLFLFVCRVYCFICSSARDLQMRFSPYFSFFSSSMKIFLINNEPKIMLDSSLKIAIRHRCCHQTLPLTPNSSFGVRLFTVVQGCNFFFFYFCTSDELNLKKKKSVRWMKQMEKQILDRLTNLQTEGKKKKRKSFLCILRLVDAHTAKVPFHQSSSKVVCTHDNT